MSFGFVKFLDGIIVLLMHLDTARMTLDELESILSVLYESHCLFTLASISRSLNQNRDSMFTLSLAGISPRGVQVLFFEMTLLQDRPS